MKLAQPPPPLRLASLAVLACGEMSHLSENLPSTSMYHPTKFHIDPSSSLGVTITFLDPPAARCACRSRLRREVARSRLRREVAASAASEHDHLLAATPLADLACGERACYACHPGQ